MNIFLTELSKIILDKYSDTETNVAIVLPNKRAKLFLKPLLSRNSDKPIWSPKFMTIDEFVFETSNLKKANNTILSFEIYQAYSKIDNLIKIPFSKFLEMANDLLADINEIDNQLINPKEIFSYLSEYKKIDEWDIENGKMTEAQSSYIKFYESIYTIYVNLRNSLLSKRTAYYGLAARELAESKNFNIGFDKIVFAGLNALSKAEQEIINHAVKNNKGELIWDTEDYFMSNKDQEAGTFLRRQFKGKPLFNSATNIESIEIIGTAQNVYQTKVAGNIIKEQYLNESNLSNTAIVLFDENLLIPLLNSIPEEINKYNITMGYPIKNSSIYSMLDIILTIKSNYIYFNQNVNEESVNTSDIINLLTNPYFSKLVDKGRCNQFVNKLKEQNTMFINREALIRELFVEDEELGNCLCNFAFSNNINITIMNSQLITLFNVIEKGVEKSSNIDINLEFFAVLDQILRDLDNIIGQYQAIEFDFKTYTKILKSNISGGNISFYGEPLTGLQIMGILETRTLDFDNLILLSVNEGFIPQNIKPSTFIPSDIKNQFRIPSIQDKTSIYAYYFYRLILKAKRIHILYSTDQSGLGSNDKSRYILQIISELSDKIGKDKITERIETPIHSEQVEAINEIEKNDTIINKVKILASRGLSASTLNSYQNCSLQYYFQQVVGIDNENAITGVLESDVMGTVMHETLESLYKPFTEKNIIASEIKKGIGQALTTSLEKHFNNSNVNYGKNLLVKEVMLGFINNFIELEKEQIDSGNEIIIKHLESKLSTILTIEDIDCEVKIKGFVDRIDSYNGMVRIIDYKTGKVLPTELSVTNMDELKSKSKAFQVLLYAYLYSKEHDIEHVNVNSGIYSMRHLSDGFMEFCYNKEKEITADILKEFEQYLFGIIKDLFNPDIPFRQTNDKKHCTYCQYVSICNK